MKPFYEPTEDQLAKLSCTWVAGFSRGKDSSSLVSWIEYLRRFHPLRGQMERPRLILSDTEVEEQNLTQVGDALMQALTKKGWECTVVKPLVHEKLYPQILGRGLPPIHPGATRLRWCTRSTKIDPMKRNKPAITMLTGLRLGESAMRDAKIAKSSCAAGGECGIPMPSHNTYSPIINWTLCQVYDWLSGAVDYRVKRGMQDIFDVTGKLLDIYDIRFGANTFDFADQEIQAARFGCIGCPAIEEGPVANAATRRRNGEGSPLNELYAVWHIARQKNNRCVQYRIKKGKWVHGPIRLAVRKLLFARVMDIQHRAGIMLITPEDELFIKQCWRNKVYPRGWSEADEATVEPNPPLIQLSIKGATP